MHVPSTFPGCSSAPRVPPLCASPLHPSTHQSTRRCHRVPLLLLLSGSCIIFAFFFVRKGAPRLCILARCRPLHLPPPLPRTSRGPQRRKKRADERLLSPSSDVQEGAVDRIPPLILPGRASALGPSACASPPALPLAFACVWTPWSRWRKSAARWADYSRPSSTT